jgi:hypothetical protein
MPAREDETIAPRPLWVARAVSQVTRPQRERHGCPTHRKTRMSGISLLNCIRGKEADGIYRTSLKIISGHYEFLRKRLSSILPNEGQISLQMKPEIPQIVSLMDKFYRKSPFVI